jgi:hypothetical protein
MGRRFFLLFLTEILFRHQHFSSHLSGSFRPFDFISVCVHVCTRMWTCVCLRISNIEMVIRFSWDILRSQFRWTLHTRVTVHIHTITIINIADERNWRKGNNSDSKLNVVIGCGEQILEKYAISAFVMLSYCVSDLDDELHFLNICSWYPTVHRAEVRWSG